MLRKFHYNWTSGYIVVCSPPGAQLPSIPGHLTAFTWRAPPPSNHCCVLCIYEIHSLLSFHIPRMSEVFSHLTDFTQHDSLQVDGNAGLVQVPWHTQGHLRTLPSAPLLTQSHPEPGAAPGGGIHRHLAGVRWEWGDRGSKLSNPLRRRKALRKQGFLALS